MSDPNRHSALDQWINSNEELLEVFLDAYCVVDTHSQVVQFNEAFLELTGLTYRKIKKMGAFSQVLPTELGEEECPCRQILDKGKPIRLDELSASTKA